MPGIDNIIKIGVGVIYCRELQVWVFFGIMYITNMLGNT